MMPLFITLMCLSLPGGLGMLIITPLKVSEFPSIVNRRRAVFCTLEQPHPFNFVLVQDIFPVLCV